MTIRLADPEVRADLTTYVRRAMKLDADGAIRLQATGSTLAAWVGVRKGRGLLGEGTVIGLRAMPLAPGSEDADEVVELRAVADRLARMDFHDSLELEMPPVTVRTSWAALTPPRSGWSRLGSIETDLLNRVATEGIAEVAQGSPVGSGAAAVETLQQRVWGRPIAETEPQVDGLPAGAALGVLALGFAVGEAADVFATARWHRVSTPAGHVLVR